VALAAFRRAAGAMREAAAIGCFWRSAASSRAEVLRQMEQRVEAVGMGEHGAVAFEMFYGSLAPVEFVGASGANARCHNGFAPVLRRVID